MPRPKTKTAEKIFGKVGVFLARSGMNMGVWVNSCGVLGASSEMGPERSFSKKWNIIISAAHQCDKDQPEVDFFFFLFCYCKSLGSWRKSFSVKISKVISKHKENFELGECVWLVGFQR